MIQIALTCDVERDSSTQENMPIIYEIFKKYEIVGTWFIQHDLGMKWSVFTEQLLTQLFRNFASDKDLKFQTTESTVILKVALGSDFNEHHYQS